MSGLVQRKDRQLDLERTPLVGESLAVDDCDDKKNQSQRVSVSETIIVALFMLFGVAVLALYTRRFEFPSPTPSEPLPGFVLQGIKQCEYIKRGPPSFEHATADRKKSDRHVPGTRPVYLKNATLWTGEDDGNEVIHGAGVWLQDGVIRRIGKGDDEFQELIAATGKSKFDEVELHGAWLTPGIVDVHSHLAVDAAPGLEGSSDTNSWKSPILPFLRSLDAFNTHDACVRPC